MAMKLVIGTKKYSSWSLRPWILMKYFAVSFEEELIAFDVKLGSRENTDDVKARMRAASPNGRIPVLVLDDGTRINESLAICEYINDCHLDGRAWPSPAPDRYLAKAVCLEMATGFMEMRRLLPMSVNSVVGRCASPPAAAKGDVARVLAILDGCLERKGEDKFLFGRFTIADAFYLPVLLRFETYRVPLPERVQAYSDRMLALDQVSEWREEDLRCPPIDGINNIIRNYPLEVAEACKI
jgi:glutathione S-transferase